MCTKQRHTAQWSIASKCLLSPAMSRNRTLTATQSLLPFWATAHALLAFLRSFMTSACTHTDVVVWTVIIHLASFCVWLISVNIHSMSTPKCFHCSMTLTYCNFVIFLSADMWIVSRFCYNETYNCCNIWYIFLGMCVCIYMYVHIYMMHNRIHFLQLS